MAKVALICLYDNWALGLRALSNALISKGHEVSIINFKLQSSKELDDYLKYPLHYETIQPNESYSKMVLRGYGIDINMWTHNEIELLGDLLEKIQPEIIGLSTRSIYENYNYVDQVIEQIKRVASAVTVAGGFGATFNPGRYLEKLDYACVGEGEDTLVKMAECVGRGNKEEIKEISNLVYRVDGKLIFNKLQPPTDSEDYLFNPLMDKIKRYVIENNIVKEGTAFMKNILDKDPVYAGEYFTMAGRGCLWECSFCSAGRFYKKYQEEGIPLKRRRLRQVEDVIRELKFVKEKYHFKRIFFMDSYLFAPQDYLMRFFELYRREIDIPFFAQFYPSQILNHPEILKSAYEAGLAHTVVGLQAGSDEICREVMNRKEPLEKIIEFSNLICQFNNVSLDYHLITHNPFEREEHVNKTFDLLSRLPKKNSQLVLARLRPFPTSKIAEMIKDANLNPVNNMERDKKNAILYLIRFYSSDVTFKKIISHIENYSFEELKNLYSLIRKEYDDKFPLYSRINGSGNPTFIQGYKGFSIIFYKRKIFALAKSLGGIDLTHVEEIKLKEYQKTGRCYIGDSVEEARYFVDRQPFYRVLKQELTVLMSSARSYVTGRIKSF